MNDPFAEFRKYMTENDDCDQEMLQHLKETAQEMTNKFEQELLLKLMKASGADEKLLHAFDILMRNGCPVSAITKTLSTLFGEEKNHES